MIPTVAEHATIREATLGDLPALRRMFESFRQTEPYCRYLAHAPEAAEAYLRWLLSDPDRVVLVRTVPDLGVVGMLAVMLYHNPMDGQLRATELFWWLDPDHRGAGGWLLRRAEKWARGRGAKALQMVSPVGNARVKETYVALGYEPMEIAYSKELGS